MSYGGKRILGIIDRLSASLLKAKEETFVIVLLENETLSKGGRVKGHQFYWRNYYLYIVGVAKEMIPNRAKQNRPHRSTSRWAPEKPSRQSHWLHLNLSSWACWQELIGFSIYPSCAVFVMANHSVDARDGYVLETVIIMRRTLPFMSTYYKNWNCVFYLPPQSTTHKIGVTMTTL